MKDILSNFVDLKNVIHMVLYPSLRALSDEELSHILKNLQNTVGRIIQSTRKNNKNL